ncbi:divergent PAP2 family protein [Acinetobacter ursingii]|uniref:divergent PAP2 family protein n=1 Tax=Acinetobacter ursingii TaxID=108980 RepID=UPI0021D199FB|nr:divergent PAP2 family protein [Acinetobacter ursingii]MCU4359313.1 divergent PAP2 family protein [Acinetobacter ursingii]
MNYYIYLITPFFAWLVCGITKFVVNCLKERRLAFDLIGYGGMPSNHSSIVSSIAALIAFQEGIDTPAFGVALTLAFIVVMDANSLRKKMEQHAKEINNLKNYEKPILRERIGHSKSEILFGIVTGIMVSYNIHLFTAHF